MTVRSPLVVLATFVACTLFATDALANCAFFADKTGIALASAQGLRVDAAAKAPAPVQELKEKGHETAVTGLWYVTVSIEGTIIDRAFETFNSDGNEMLVDTAPPAAGNVCNGIWASLGHRGYRIKHPSWVFDMDGMVTGTAIIRTELVLNKNGNEFTGQAVLYFYDLDGKFLSQTPPAEIKGLRITVD